MERNMEHNLDKYQGRDGGVTLHTWTEVQGLKKENYYITGEPGTAIPAWFRNILRKKHLTDIIDFPHCPSSFYD
jgi:hypothetical protein